MVNSVQFAGSRLQIPLHATNISNDSIQIGHSLQNSPYENLDQNQLARFKFIYNQTLSIQISRRNHATLPEIKFTLEEINVAISSLGNKLKSGPFIVGGASLFIIGGHHLPSDTDVCYFLAENAKDEIFSLLASFFAKKLSEMNKAEHQFDSTYKKIKEIYLEKMYTMKGSSLFIFLGNNLDLQFLLDFKQRRFIAKHEGLMVALVQNPYYFYMNLLGKSDIKELQTAVQLLKTCRYEVDNPHLVEKLFFRLILKVTKGNSFSEEAQKTAFLNLITDDEKSYLVTQENFQSYILKHFSPEQTHGKLFVFLNFLTLNYQSGEIVGKVDKSVILCQKIASIWRADKKGFLYNFSELLFKYKEYLLDFINLIQGIYFVSFLREKSKNLVGYPTNQSTGFYNGVYYQQSTQNQFIPFNKFYLIFSTNPVDLCIKFIKAWINLEHLLKKDKSDYAKFLLIGKETGFIEISLSETSRSLVIHELIHAFYNEPLKSILSKQYADFLNPLDFLLSIEKEKISSDDSEFINSQKIQFNLSRLHLNASKFKNDELLNLSALLRKMVSDYCRTNFEKNLLEIFSILENLHKSKSTFLDSSLLRTSLQCIFIFISKINSATSLEDLIFLKTFITLTLKSTVYQNFEKKRIVLSFYERCLKSFGDSHPQHLIHLHQFHKSISTWYKSSGLPEIELNKILAEINSKMLNLVNDLFKRNNQKSAFYAFAAAISSYNYKKNPKLTDDLFNLLSAYILQDKTNQFVPVFLRCTMKIFSDLTIDDKLLEILQGLLSKTIKLAENETHSKLAIDILKMLYLTDKLRHKVIITLIHELGKTLIHDSVEITRKKSKLLLSILSVLENNSFIASLKIQKQSLEEIVSCTLEEFIEAVASVDISLAYYFLTKNTNVKRQMKIQTYVALHWLLLEKLRNQPIIDVAISDHLWNLCKNFEYSSVEDHFDTIRISLLILQKHIESKDFEKSNEVVSFYIKLLKSSQQLNKDQVKTLEPLIINSFNSLAEHLSKESLELIETYYSILVNLLDHKSIISLFIFFLENCIKEKVQPSLILLQNFTNLYSNKLNEKEIQILNSAISEATVSEPYNQHYDFIIELVNSFLTPDLLTENIQNFILDYLNSFDDFGTFVSILSEKRFLARFSDANKFKFINLCIQKNSASLIETYWEQIKPTENTAKNTTLAICETLSKSKCRTLINLIKITFLDLGSNDGSIYAFYLKGQICLCDPKEFEKIAIDFEHEPLFELRNIKSETNDQANEIFNSYKEECQKENPDLETLKMYAEMTKLNWELGKAKISEAIFCIQLLTEYVDKITSQNSKPDLINAYIRFLKNLLSDLDSYTAKNEFFETKTHLIETIIKLSSYHVDKDSLQYTCSLFIERASQSENAFLSIIRSLILIPENQFQKHFETIANFLNQIAENNDFLFPLKGLQFKELISILTKLQEFDDRFHASLIILKTLLVIAKEKCKVTNVSFTLEKKSQDSVAKVFSLFFENALVHKKHSWIYVFQDFITQFISELYRKQIFNSDVRFTELAKLTLTHADFMNELDKLQMRISMLNLYNLKAIDKLIESFILEVREKVFSSILATEVFSKSDNYKILISTLDFIHKQRLNDIFLNSHVPIKTKVLGKDNKLCDSTSTVTMRLFLETTLLNIIRSLIVHVQNESPHQFSMLFLEYLDKYHRFEDPTKGNLEFFTGYCCNANNLVISDYLLTKTKTSVNFFKKFCETIKMETDNQFMIIENALMWFIFPIIVKAVYSILSLKFPKHSKQALYVVFKLWIKSEQAEKEILKHKLFFKNKASKTIHNLINSAMPFLQYLRYDQFYNALEDSVQNEMLEIAYDFIHIPEKQFGMAVYEPNGVRMKFVAQLHPFLCQIDTYEGFSDSFRKFFHSKPHFKRAPLFIRQGTLLAELAKP